MTLNLSSEEPQSSLDQESAAHVTVIGLFEDMIDARNLFSTLRKEDCPSEAVSFIIRDRKADEGGPAERHGAIARAVDNAELNGSSDWLLGLTSLIVPERGTFLVAGIIGAALAGVTIEDTERGVPEPALGAILEDFGFGADEVAYIESRLVAGAMLVGVTSNDQSLLSSARGRLSENNAVHIGAARTSHDVAEAATALLASPPEVYGNSDVVVTDAVAPLQMLFSEQREVGWASALKGRTIVDRDGEECGRIEDLIAEVRGGAEVEREHLRYVVIRFGGVLGIGRRYAAVPVNHATFGDDEIQVSVTRAVLQQAPTFDPGAPFSRREEQVVCAYFGCTPYWEE